MIESRELEPAHGHRHDARELVAAGSWSVIWLLTLSILVHSVVAIARGEASSPVAGNALGSALGNVWFGWFFTVPLSLVSIGIAWILIAFGAPKRIGYAIPTAMALALALATPGESGDLRLVPTSIALTTATIFLVGWRQLDVVVALAASCALFIGTIAVWLFAVARRKRPGVLGAAVAAGLLPSALLAVDALRSDATPATFVALILFLGCTLIASVMLVTRRAW